MEQLLRPDRFNADPNAASARDEWTYWHQTFVNYFEEIPENKRPDQLKTLINFLSASVYKTIAHCTTYEEAMLVLKDQFEKPVNEIYAHHALAIHRQQDHETIDQFLQSFKELAKDCNFTQVTAAEHCAKAISDAFIFGLISADIRQRLLENTKLDLHSAFGQARALECAQKNQVTFMDHRPLVNSATLGTSKWDKPGTDPEVEEHSFCQIKRLSCFFCGGPRHPRTRCPAREATCRNCNKKGHFTKVYKSDKAISKTISGTAHKTITSILAGTPQLLSNAFVNVTVHGKSLSALIDSGSSESFISESLGKLLKVQIIPSSASITMASTSLVTQVIGECFINFTIANRDYDNTKFLILPNLCCEMLLGQDFMRLHDSVRIQFGGPQPQLKICNLAAMTSEPPSLFNLKSDCRPIAIPSRRYSPDNVAFIKEEIQKLLNEGIIEASNSPWRAQVLITSDGRHKKRMVIDYSQTVNRFTTLNAYPLPRIDDLASKVSKFRIFSAFKSQYYPRTNHSLLLRLMLSYFTLIAFLSISLMLSPDSKKEMDDLFSFNNLNEPLLISMI